MKPTGVFHPQLAAIKQELDDATQRAKRLGDSLGDAAFTTRPSTGGWSPAECIAHLSLTTKAFLPLIDSALQNAPRNPADPARRYRTGIFAGWFARVLEPPYRIKAKTMAPFDPASAGTADEVLREFERLQAELLSRLAAANDVDVSAVRVQSPFSSRMHYNLLAAFKIITAHERRHLWQAEKAAR